MIAKALTIEDFQQMIREANIQTNIYRGAFCSVIESARNFLVDGGVSERMEKAVNGFQFIPHSPDKVCEMIVSAYKVIMNDRKNDKSFDPVDWERNSVKFLDAGCGVGNIMMLVRSIANTMNWAISVHGIEYDDQTLAIARHAFGKSSYGTEAKERVMKDNLLTFTDYKDYDIVYFYCPLRGLEQELIFEDLLFSNVKVGAIIIDCLFKMRDYHEEVQNKGLPAFKTRKTKSCDIAHYKGKLFCEIKTDWSSHVGWRRVK